MREAAFSLVVPCLVMLGLLLLKPGTNTENEPMTEAELRAAKKEWDRFWLINQQPQTTKLEETNKDAQQDN